MPISSHLKSWIDISKDSDFPLQNIPFGIFKTDKTKPLVCSRIGDFVINLAALSELGLLQDVGVSLSYFEQDSLNELMTLGKEVSVKVRERIAELFSEHNSEIKDYPEIRNQVINNISEVEMLMPIKVGDYTDFYSSKEHATNVGTMFRDPENALLPNWKHIPVGYHGRASSIIVSGTSIHRPKGQLKPEGVDTPEFGPSRLLDFELEMAFITCKDTCLGESISIENSENAIWGMVLFNDWSARDIQKWEYVPLGPFLAKSFASSISPWVVTLDALEPFRTNGPEQDVEVLPYLRFHEAKSFDINLEVYLFPEGEEENLLCKSNFKNMYWNMSQQLAHQTSNGCNIRVGDLYASGTISGPTPDSYGSMLELCWKGTKPIILKSGNQRKFIQDYDTIMMKGYCKKDDLRVGFGEVNTKVLPAN